MNVNVANIENVAKSLPTDVNVAAVLAYCRTRLLLDDMFLFGLCVIKTDGYPFDRIKPADWTAIAGLRYRSESGKAVYTVNDGFEVMSVDIPAPDGPPLDEPPLDESAKT